MIAHNCRSCSSSSPASSASSAASTSDDERSIRTWALRVSARMGSLRRCRTGGVATTATRRPSSKPCRWPGLYRKPHRKSPVVLSDFPSFFALDLPAMICPFRWLECEVAMQKLNAATGVTAAFGGLALAAGASAAELKILSAGAVQPGLNAAAKIFFDKTGDLAKIAYDPATVLGKRVAGGEVADIIVSSPAVIAELTKTAKVLPEGQVPLGKVGVGVVVREGAPAPDIASTQALKKALLDAEAVVYNTASIGAYA